MGFIFSMSLNKYISYCNTNFINDWKFEGKSRCKICLAYSILKNKMKENNNKKGEKINK